MQGFNSMGTQLPHLFIKVMLILEGILNFLSPFTIHIRFNAEFRHPICFV